MKLSKTLWGTDPIEIPGDLDREERQVALEYVAEAWNDAEDDGVSSLALAHASLFAALTSLVGHHGESAVAAMVSALQQKIEAGEYSLGRSLQ